MLPSTSRPGPQAVAYSQELQLNDIFDQLSESFKALSSMSQSRQQVVLKEMTAKMQLAKTLIREFDKDARMNGMPDAELNVRKKQLVQELNSFIGLKKAYAAGTAQGSDPAGSSASRELSQKRVDGMSNLELMEMGRQGIKDTDLALARSQKVVDDTIAVGAQTAESLQTQGRQLEKIGADLDEIHFSARKAREVIRDMAKNLAKDKCIMSFLLLVILAIVAVIIIKAAHIGNSTAAG